MPSTTHPDGCRANPFGHGQPRSELANNSLRTDLALASRRVRVDATHIDCGSLPLEPLVSAALGAGIRSKDASLPPREASLFCQHDGSVADERPICKANADEHRVGEHRQSTTQSARVRSMGRSTTQNLGANVRAIGVSERQRC